MNTNLQKNDRVGNWFLSFFTVQHDSIWTTIHSISFGYCFVTVLNLFRKNPVTVGYCSNVTFRFSWKVSDGILCDCNNLNMQKVARFISIKSTFFVFQPLCVPLYLPYSDRPFVWLLFRLRCTKVAVNFFCDMFPCCQVFNEFITMK